MALWTVGMQVAVWTLLSRHDTKVSLKNRKIIAKYCGDNKVLTNVKLIAFHTHRLKSTAYKYILYVLLIFIINMLNSNQIYCVIYWEETILPALRHYSKEPQRLG